VLSSLEPGRTLPGCAGLQEAWQAAPPGAVLLMHGAADPANPPVACAAAAAALLRSGWAVPQVQYDSAGYAWDYPVYGQEEGSLLPRPDARGRVYVQPVPWLVGRSAIAVARFLGSAPGRSRDKSNRSFFCCPKRRGDKGGRPVVPSRTAVAATAVAVEEGSHVPAATTLAFAQRLLPVSARAV